MCHGQWQYSNDLNVKIIIIKKRDCTHEIGQMRHSYLFDKCLRGPRLKIEVAPSAPRLQVLEFLAPSIVIIGRPK